MRSIACISIILMFTDLFAQDGGIIFKEDFEAASIQEVIGRWDQSANSGGMTFSSDVPEGSPGTQSIVMSYIPGHNTGGHLYKTFPEGYDSLFARFYVKFMDGHSGVHHFVHMGAYNPPSYWPQGGAGSKPLGNERFTTGIEPIGDKWSWDFYAYWMHMRGYANPNYFWGNTFNPDPPAPIQRGEWICVELMMKVNNPVSSYNGEMAFWINGQKIQHLGEGFPSGYWVWDKFYPHPDSTAFEGFQWRNDEDLKVNFFWLLYYMTEGASQTRVYFDDVLVSTQYIGPFVKGGVEGIVNRNIEAEVCPNPFTNSTKIKYALTEQEKVKIDVYNSQGIRVVTIVEEVQGPGEHFAVFKGDYCSSGIYFYKIKTGERNMKGKMVLLR